MPKVAVPTKTPPEPPRIPLGGAARRCPGCDTVFVVWADQWDCGCCWLCWECIDARKTAA